ncbi:major intrinsically disordered NOTCH2-binding receptor 1-like [Protopterus annectens]|uniref:major intrinsically disordered NOTCH2-binding receptor 1-like n=1 Tax=Protopterus annectens TaxID=7888 RepID=UPI001CFC0499|nr:major intrinsically disordered NOTCH2-binding receptor 1-like [Protopterus annectens]
MDLSVLPNNNHPDKFLLLDVNALPVGSTLFQTGIAAFNGKQKWQNRVYLQRELRKVTGQEESERSERSPVTDLLDRDLGKHITPVTLRPKIKKNPLYSDITTIYDSYEQKTNKPSWTVQDYEKRSTHAHLAEYIKEDPNDLKYWMSDIYTPGYDSLLKKTENEKKRAKLHKIIIAVSLTVSALVIVITVTVIFA